MTFLFLGRKDVDSCFVATLAVLGKLYCLYSFKFICSYWSGLWHLLGNSVHPKSMIHPHNSLWHTDHFSNSFFSFIGVFGYELRENFVPATVSADRQCHIVKVAWTKLLPLHRTHSLFFSFKHLVQDSVQWLKLFNILMFFFFPYCLLVSSTWLSSLLIFLIFI